MDRFDTPDVLVGVGGAGSQIVYQFMEQDWILESAIGLGQFAEEDTGKLEAYTVDSAAEDSVHDRVETIQQNIASHKSGRDEDDDLIKVSLDHYQMVERTPREWQQTNVLTSAEDISGLLEERRMNAWWFEAGKEPLQKMSNEGFSGGVYRRRAVSKALFNISEYAGRGVTPPSAVDDEVVMVAALGGGTGSGAVIDMAAEMDADHIDLFAVIPTTGEKRKEKTNAFAALSELEHLEINGESPFRTITLFPYLGGAGNEGQASDEEAAMAVVRSIVAHHQGMRGENLRDMLNTGSSNGPPAYAPFTMAVPKTIEYNIEKRDRAEAEIRETLTKRKEELTAESNLCDLVSAFLDREFSELEQVEPPSGEDHRESLVGLRNRVEDLFENTLQQDEVTVAGIDEERDSLVELYDKIRENVFTGRNVDSSDVEAAKQYADSVAEQLRGDIAPDEYGDDGTLGHQLAEVVQHELTVVKKRYELLERIYKIPKLADSLGIDTDAARTMQDVLVEVVLDPEETVVGTVQNPSFNVVFDNHRKERDRLVREHGQYEAFESALERTLAEQNASLRSAIENDIDTIGTINARFGSVLDGHDDTLDRIDTLVERVQRKVDQILGMKKPGEVDPTLAFDEFDNLNDDLVAIGLPTIDRENIIRGLRHLLDAKNASLDHNSGFIPGRPDRSQDYNNAVARLEGEHEGFVVGEATYTPSVEDQFEATFDPSVVRRGRSVMQYRRNAIDSVVDTVTQELCRQDGTLFEPDTRDLIESELDRVPDTIRVTLDLPNGLTADELRAAVRDRLGDSEEGDPTALLDALFPPMEDVQQTGETLTARRAEAYLRPVESALSEIEAKLDVLGDNRITDSEGVLGTFERIESLAGRFDQTSVDADLPSVTGTGTDEVYGADLSEVYEGDTDFGIGLGGGARRKNHPYVRDKEAEVPDLAGSPNDIEESNVLDNHESNIFTRFAESAKQMFDGAYGRAPIEDFSPSGSGDEERANYRGLRYVNVYGSRALSHSENLTPDGGTIHPEVTEEFRQKTVVGPSTYGEAQYAIGGPDEISMVTFVAGLTLDNIGRTGGPEGYERTHREMRQNHPFFATHHVVGLGGQWDRWTTLGDWIDPNTDEPHGAYLYRDQIQNMDRQFVTTMQESDTEEIVEKLNGMTATESFPSTVDTDE